MVKIGIVPGSAGSTEQKIFSVWAKMPSGLPPAETLEMRWDCGWAAILDSSATFRASDGLWTSLACSGPETRL